MENFFPKRSILDVWQGSEYTSAWGNWFPKSFEILLQNIVNNLPSTKTELFYFFITVKTFKLFVIQFAQNFSKLINATY